MRWIVFPAVVALFIGMPPAARAGILEDITAGKLIAPEVGVFAWYELTDTATKGKLYLRQAVVGEEKVKRKTGYWVETEIIPQVGFPAVYKMLLTGPANEEGSIHKVIVREGQEPPRDVPVEEGAGAPAPKPQDRTSLGAETITTIQGPIESEHVAIQQGDKKIEVWLNDTVRPLGIVKMVTPEGELLLQRFGKGGPDGGSHIDSGAGLAPANGEPQGDVRVEAETGTVAVPPTAPEASTTSTESTAPADLPAEPTKGTSVKKNFGGRKSRP